MQCHYLKSRKISRPAFFYCSRNPAELERSDPEAILASSVRQLCCFDVGYPLLIPKNTNYDSEQRFLRFD